MYRGHRWISLAVIGLPLGLSGCGSSTQPAGGRSAAPTVIGIDPPAVTTSSLQRTITVDGTGFQSGLTVTLTTPSGSTNPAPSEITATSFQITAIFATGNYTIAVANPGGQASSPFSFAAKPAIGINFAPRVDYATGATSSGAGLGSASIAIADFNGDGKLDIAVSNYSSNTVSVFLNKGDGSFGSPVITTVNPLGALGLGAIVAGDFNEDGKTDLIVSTIAGAQSDIVLLGNGNGAFTQAAPIPSTYGFLQARVVDLNGDKHLDLVAGDNGNMTVALGKGDGTFSPGVWLQMGPLVDSYIAIDVGDLTSNSKLDIVGVDWTPSAGDLVVFGGNGDGTFQAPTWQSPAPLVPDSVAIADFNGDGVPDLLLGFSQGMGVFSSSAAIALGNGAGTFNLASNAQISIYTSSQLNNNGIIVRVADLDQDGKPDALIADRLAGVIAVALNNGTTIASGSKYTFTATAGVCDMATGDLNGDGMPDVVVVNNLTNEVSVFLSQAQ
jgi:hypothetical protein